MINLDQKQKKVRLKKTFNIVNALYVGQELTLIAFKSGIFPIKATKGEGLKIPLRLPIALAQVKAVNTSDNLLNEIRKIIYSLYRAQKITKNVYNNIMNSIKL